MLSDVAIRPKGSLGFFMHGHTDRNCADAECQLRPFPSWNRTFGCRPSACRSQRFSLGQSGPKETFDGIFKI